MKTRIKQVQYGDGSIIYIPQKNSFTTKDYIICLLIPLLGWAVIYSRYTGIPIDYQNTITIFSSEAVFKSEIDAKNFIDGFIKYITDEAKRQLAFSANCVLAGVIWCGRILERKPC